MFGKPVEESSNIALSAWHSDQELPQKAQKWTAILQCFPFYLLFFRDSAVVSVKGRFTNTVQQGIFEEGKQNQLALSCVHVGLHHITTDANRLLLSPKES